MLFPDKQKRGISQLQKHATRTEIGRVGSTFRSRTKLVVRREIGILFFKPADGTIETTMQGEQTVSKLVSQGRCFVLQRIYLESSTDLNPIMLVEFHNGTHEGI